MNKMETDTEHTEHRLHFTYYSNISVNLRTNFIYRNQLELLLSLRSAKTKLRIRIKLGM